MLTYNKSIDVRVFISLLFLCMIALGTFTSSACAGGGAEKPKKEGPFIDVGALTLCIIKDREVKGYIRMTIKVFAPKEDVQDTIRILVPRIRSAYVMHLSSVLSNFWIVGEQPDLTNIKDFLLTMTRNALEGDVDPKKIEGVYIDSYFFAEPPDPA